MNALKLHPLEQRFLWVVTFQASRKVNRIHVSFFVTTDKLRLIHNLFVLKNFIVIFLLKLMKHKSFELATFPTYQINIKFSVKAISNVGNTM